MQIRWHKALGVFILLVGVAFEVSLIPIAIRTTGSASVLEVLYFLFMAVFIGPYFFLALGLRTIRNQSFAVMSLGIVLVFGPGIFLPMLLIVLLAPLSWALAVAVVGGVFCAGVSGGIALSIAGWRRMRAEQQ